MAFSFLIKLALLAAISSIAYSVGIYQQCGGDGYGLFPCDAGLTCFRRNNVYSSCQYTCPKNQGWECEAYYYPPTPAPTIAAGWDQCGGDGWVGPRVCEAGYACYTRSVYFSQCRPIGDCPADGTWVCSQYVATTPAPIYYPTTPATVYYPSTPATVYYPSTPATVYYPSTPATVYYPSTPATVYYPSTPATVYYPSTPATVYYPTTPATVYYPTTPAPVYVPTTPATVYYPPTATPVYVPSTAAPVGPVVLPINYQCNNVGNAMCAAGLGCFRNNVNYAECRPFCPAGWACETDYLGPNEQCGGEDYVGVTRCAAGLNCYQRSRWYSFCAASCPGADWVC